MTSRTRAIIGLALSAALCATALAAPAAGPAPALRLAQLESEFADLNDAIGALGLIDSGLATSHLGKDRRQWQADYGRKLAAVRGGLQDLRADGLAPEDARAVQLIRASVDSLQDEPDSLAPVGRCGDAQRAGLGRAELQEALYACFAELANNLEFEGSKVTRVAAFDLLTRLDEPARRRDLFYAFVPLWQAVNGRSEATSPYRRMLALAAAEARREGSEIDAAARTVGVPSAAIEDWLEQVLDTWRQVTPSAPVEPWDYRYASGAAERELGNAIAREQLLPMSQRFYLDLGANLESLAILHDLDPRPGKAPLAYTDYVSRGRMTGGSWRPTVVRISGNYGRGGLALLNELVHEDGHAVHMMALRTRPAFMDLGDTLFLEAFADVPSWSVYEPAWQQRYLGRSAAEAASLRSLYASVMLDVAWALFDLRMLRDPSADPNRVWTEITSRYLHVVPHPELSWWAVRVQLVDKPGYMVNYGLGAVLTADMRLRTREQIGAFDAGNPRWYGWLSERLLVSGQQHETATLLREFLGRPTSPAALLAELRRLQGPPAARPPVDAGSR